MAVYLQNPGVNARYDYAGHTAPTITQAQIDSTLVGNAIQQKYSLGAWTPAQKSRLVVITLLAVGALAAIASLAVALTVCKPFLIAAVLFTAATGCGIYYQCTRGPDFDDPVVRARQIVRIANISLRALTDEYAPEDVVRYNLLNAKVNQMDPQTVPKVYAYVNELMLARGRIDVSVNRDKNAAQAAFDAATAPARHVRDMRQNESDMRRRTVEVISRHNQRLAVSAERDAYHVMENINEANIRSDYDVAVANWDAWLTTEKLRIDTARDAAVGILETNYQTAFANDRLIPVVG